MYTIKTSDLVLKMARWEAKKQAAAKWRRSWLLRWLAMAQKASVKDP